MDPWYRVDVHGSTLYSFQTFTLGLARKDCDAKPMNNTPTQGGGDDR